KSQARAMFARISGLEAHPDSRRAVAYSGPACGRVRLCQCGRQDKGARERRCSTEIEQWSPAPSDRCAAIENRETSLLGTKSKVRRGPISRLRIPRGSQLRPMLRRLE